MDLTEMKAELKRWKKLDIVQYLIIKSDFIKTLVNNGYTKDAAESVLNV